MFWVLERIGRSRKETMNRKQTFTTALALALAIAALALFFAAPAGESNGPGDGEGQRTGLVETAQMFEETSTFYPSGAEYAQAVYASQGITISTDLGEDTYSIDAVAPGDVVIGEGYVGILVDDTTAMGVPHDGGPVQVYRVTTEDVRRVDW